MKTIGPTLNTFQKFRSLIFSASAFVALVIIGLFVLDIQNKGIFYIGVFGYVILLLTFALRMVAERISLNTDKKLLSIHTYNVLSQKEIVIPFKELQFEAYKNMLSSKGKGGLIFSQNDKFIFFLTAQQPGWTPELIDEVTNTLRQYKLSEKVETKAKNKKA